MYNRIIKVAAFACVVLLNYSCKKMIAIESPKNQLSTDKVFADTASATAALLNIYDGLQNQQYTISNQYLSVYSDESLATSSANLVWNQSRVPSNATPINGIWTYSYSAIYQSNLIIEQSAQAQKLPAAFVSRIRAEAKFLRAYSYFYLINYFGRIPLALTSNVNENRALNQTDSVEVYKQIVSDLISAQADLPVVYQGGGKVRANKACATALLAKVYLFQRNWALAESLSNEVINSGAYTPLEPLANVFKANSKESILQLATPTGFVTEASSALPTSSTVAPTYYFTDGFNASFETNDQRKTAWIGTSTVNINGAPIVYKYPAKYKNRVANTASPENLSVLRLAEQYLIRAESRAFQGKITGSGSAEDDINIVRARAGLTALKLANLNAAMTAVLNERRHELFFENGSRFMDLKRTGLLQAVMSVNKPTWIMQSRVLPIPASEIIYNSNLIQNDSY